MAAELRRCTCPGSFEGGPCPAEMTQEDGRCDWCRAIDCPTATWENAQERITRAEAMGLRQRVATFGQVPPR